MRLQAVLAAFAVVWAGYCPSAIADDAAPPGAAVATSDATLAAAGQALYAQHCSHCHGFNMVNPGTIAYDLRRFPHDGKERFVNSVTNGKNGRMPPWGGALSHQDIDALWAYVLTGGNT